MQRNEDENNQKFIQKYNKKTIIMKWLSGSFAQFRASALGFGLPQKYPKNARKFVRHIFYQNSSKVEVYH